MSRKLLQYIALTKSELDNYVQDESSCIFRVFHKTHIGFPPHGLGNVKDTLRNLITNKQIGAYEKGLEGIVLAIKNMKVINNLWPVRGDSWVLHFDVEADFYIFRPKVGLVLEGVCKYRAKKHISAVIYRVFSVAIRFQKGTDMSNIAINSNIKFMVKEFNLKSNLPYIEGELIRENVPTTSANKRTVFSDNEDENLDSGISTEDLCHEPTTTVSKSSEDEDQKPITKSATKQLKSILKTPTSIKIKQERTSRSPSPNKSTRFSTDNNSTIIFDTDSIIAQSNIKTEPEDDEDEPVFKTPRESPPKKRKNKRTSFDALESVKDLLSQKKTTTENDRRPTTKTVKRKLPMDDDDDDNSRPHKKKCKKAVATTSKSKLRSPSPSSDDEMNIDLPVTIKKERTSESRSNSESEAEEVSRKSIKAAPSTYDIIPSKLDDTIDDDDEMLSQSSNMLSSTKLGEDHDDDNGAKSSKKKKKKKSRLSLLEMSTALFDELL